jgi:hypothetical protein
MKSSLLSFFCAALLLHSGCSFFAGMGDSPPPQPATAPDLPGEKGKFTGLVVKVDEGYRFQRSDDPSNLQQLTKAKKSKDFKDEEIQLRKYFGKTLAVQGESREGWIAGAEVLGQWLHPGEIRGSTLTGPEPKTRQ